VSVDVIDADVPLTENQDSSTIDEGRGKRLHSELSRYESEDEEEERRSRNRFSESPARENSPENDKKRPRIGEEEQKSTTSSAPGNVQPSRVVFVRQLPSNTTVHDLEGLTEEVGGCEEIVLIEKKCQAFLEFKDIEVARNFLERYNYELPIRGKKTIADFSIRQQLIRPQTDEKPNNILLVVVTNAIYPITTDVLYQVFKKYGEVEIIVIFESKSGQLQALVQYSKQEMATEAKKTLNNQNIYKECCRMSILFSKMNNITVNQNNDRTKDYRNNGLGSDLDKKEKDHSRSNNRHDDQRDDRQSNRRNGRDTSDRYDQPRSPRATDRYSDHRSDRGYDRGYDRGSDRHSDRRDYGRDYYGDRRDERRDRDFDREIADRHRYDDYYRRDSERDRARDHRSNNPVVLVSNIDKRTTINQLFTLMGVYGDVAKIKIIHNKPDSALVQFMNNQGADTCLALLRSGVPLFDGKLNISRSKHYSINYQSNEFDDRLYKNFTNSIYHRFKHSSSKNLDHICEPSRTLHVSNVNGCTTEEELQKVFEKHGKVENVRFFGNKKLSGRDEKKMASVRMETLESAVRSLVELHETEVNKMDIKITFSEKRSENRDNGRERNHHSNPDRDDRSRAH
ncbi:hypothetical protein AKO1_001966, partial [Acrasis kona]